MFLSDGFRLGLNTITVQKLALDTLHLGDYFSAGEFVVQTLNLSAASGFEFLVLGRNLVGTAGADLWDFSGLVTEIFGGDAFDLRAGNDKFTGSLDRDKVYGGLGNDLVYGGIGYDSIYAGDGNDTVYGGYGNDTVYGDFGLDVISLGSGNDLFVDDPQNDANGHDYVTGDGGHDSLLGGTGNDVIYGGIGDDMIDAGDGDDTVYGGQGSDQIHCLGTGHTRIVYTQGDHAAGDVDTIWNFNDSPTPTFWRSSPCWSARSHTVATLLLPAALTTLKPGMMAAL